MRNYEVMRGIKEAEQAIKQYENLPENIRNTEWIQTQLRKAKADRKTWMEILISTRRQQVVDEI